LLARNQDNVSECDDIDMFLPGNCCLSEPPMIIQLIDGQGHSGKRQNWYHNT